METGVVGSRVRTGSETSGGLSEGVMCVLWPSDVPAPAVLVTVAV